MWPTGYPPFSFTNTCEKTNLNGVVRLMAADGLQGWPWRKCRRWRGGAAIFPSGVVNLLDRDILEMEAMIATMSSGLTGIS